LHYINLYYARQAIWEQLYILQDFHRRLCITTSKINEVAVKHVDELAPQREKKEDRKLAATILTSFKTGNHHLELT
jgi:hypothetical protein